ncbi:28S ribosomal protein S31, mitochondrial [Armadillidium nasatum]|uniref:Small ribosomal subunit protein mS31 n=1 Tax=Armadillidium nasatum TaxID=96803 RepID=A0A5N5SLW3_9CRUS|nr:28S ribosomal protein S31, mitochondrial [Armadillidium nasatum]
MKEDLLVHLQIASDEENGKSKSKTEVEKENAKTQMKSSFSQVKMDKDEKEKEVNISAKSDEKNKLKEETRKKTMDLLSSFKVKVGMDEEFRSPSTFLNFEKEVDEKEKDTKLNEEIELKEETKKKMLNLLSTYNKKTYDEDEAIKITQAQPRKIEEKTETDVEFIDFSVKKAVKDVADLLGGDKVKKAETESELLHSLRSVTSPKLDLSDIVSEMKISDSKDFELENNLERKFPVSGFYELRKMNLPRRRTDLKLEKVDVFGSPPLDIFPKDFKPEGKESVLGLWDSLNEREMKFSVAQQPRNYFEEMINWTEEGKVWTFPVDNEIGLEEEKSYSFADHIFLENHLSEWCPKKGPIRHFMELVCVGLSKNPYLTVNRKIAHIEWYKDYFDSKKDLLQDIGAL